MFAYGPKCAFTDHPVLVLRPRAREGLIRRRFGPLAALPTVEFCCAVFELSIDAIYLSWIRFEGTVIPLSIPRRESFPRNGLIHLEDVYSGEDRPQIMENRAYPQTPA